MQKGFGKSQGGSNSQRKGPDRDTGNMVGAYNTEHNNEVSENVGKKSVVAATADPQSLRIVFININSATRSDGLSDEAVSSE